MGKVLLIFGLCILTISTIFAADFFKIVKTGTPKQVIDAIAAGANPNEQRDMTDQMKFKENQEWENMDSPIMVAARFNSNPEIIKALVAAGADANYADALFSQHPLAIACGYNNIEVVRALIEAGADKDAFGYRCPCPVTSAASNDNIDIVKYVINDI